MTSGAWERAYAARFEKSQFGDDAIGLFALGLKFGIDDMEAVGTEIITGSGDDKKCDLVYLDKEEGRCVVAQCYVSKRERPAAPANKASDLNTAITWLLATPIEKLPERLKSSAAEIREAINTDKLREFNIWYVHNLPESKNVSDELNAVEHSANAAIKGIRSSAVINVLGREIGTQTFARLYQESETPILVTDKIAITVPVGFRVKGTKWSAYQTILPGKFFYDLYKKHGLDLFSANVRDYLGSRASDSNINYGIKQTAEEEPDNFWVYNNGITALVNGLQAKQRNGKISVTINGISIVNGAQTTGAIGSLAERPKKGLAVAVRFIWTKNEVVVEDIIKYNNSQNKISASDFRSTDATQKRLKAEFAKIPGAEYEGGRRGGASDRIKRRPNLLPSYTVGQALAAFHGDPVIAYDRKSDIWINDRTYSNYFKDETTARHIVFVYSLYRAIGKKKLGLIEKVRAGLDRTQIEKEQLEFFEKKGAMLLTCAAVADCLETILDRPIPNRFRLSFGVRISPDKAESFWVDVLEPLFPLISQLNAAFSANRISTELTKKAVPAFRDVVAAVSAANLRPFKKFSSNVKVD